MRILLAIALLVAPLPLAAQSTPGRTITKSEIRAADPRRTHGRLRDVIWDMFEREDVRSEAQPRHALTDFWLRTRPRGTEIPGLCRYDGVTVEFAPTSRRDRGADTPVRAVGLRASSFFHFISPPTQQFHDAANYDLLPSDGDCRSLDANELPFFRSEDEQVAVNGYLAFLRLQDALRANQTMELDCYPGRMETRTCREIILAIGTDAVSDVRRCEWSEARQNCFRIRADDLQIDILVTGRVSPGPPPGQVLRARLGFLIVLSHPRPD
ncbi:MAG: hypothetical protein ACT4N8_15015 [Sphingosinicella sp.]|uniref:hypothetical protein n=1 Tax=Sphingosinicella sp. TaxID=1917971 RepID=UPI004037A09C